MNSSYKPVQSILHQMVSAPLMPRANLLGAQMLLPLSRIIVVEKSPLSCLPQQVNVIQFLLFPPVRAEDASIRNSL